MRKRSFLLLGLIMFGVFTFVDNVNADEEDRTCNAVSLNELRTKAANIKVTYEAGDKVVHYSDPDPGSYDPSLDADVEEDTSNSDIIRYMDLKIYNLTSDLYVLIEGENLGNDKSTIASLNNVGKDKSATIRLRLPEVVSTYTFTVFSDAYGCSTQTLRKIRLTVPRFNNYSDLEICKDIPDYYLCQQYVTYNIDGSTFFNKVEDYKAKLLANDSDKEGIKTDDNTGVVSKTFSTISKNKYIVVGVVVVVGVIATIFILKRKKSEL